MRVDMINYIPCLKYNIYLKYYFRKKYQFTSAYHKHFVRDQDILEELFLKKFFFRHIFSGYHYRNNNTIFTYTTVIQENLIINIIHLNHYGYYY